MDINTDAGYTLYTDIPPDIFAREGYEYRDYFNALRLLRGKISAVTIWGLADDHTWLTSGGNVRAPLPFDQSLHAKPAYWGMVDPTQLPGSQLTGSIASKSGTQNARVWTIMLSNPGPGIAYFAQVTGFTLTQVAGAACTPVISSPAAFPVNLGNIAAGASASVPFTIDFTGCPALARFAVNIPFSSGAPSSTNIGADLKAIVRNHEYR